MASPAPTLYLFDRFDNRLGILPVVGDVTHTEELGGEDTLEFCCLDVPTKGDRILWHDDMDGCWREHVVVRTDEPLEGLSSVYCESSVSELLNDYIEERRLVSYTASAALGVVLSNSRWAVAATANLGTASGLLYHVNALTALRRLERLYSAYAVAHISVADGMVSGRSLSLEGGEGAWRGARFTYGKNMVGCTRTVLEDEVKTALYGWGAGLPIVSGEEYSGGFRRKLSFADVNGGVKWVGDEDARLEWGRWDATRTQKVHSFGEVTFSECRDPDELLALTRAELARVCRPQVSYEVDVALLDGGVPVALGDKVAVIDNSREPPWRLSARVLRRIRTFGEDVETHVTLGTVQRASYAQTSDVERQVEILADAAGANADGEVGAIVTQGDMEAIIEDLVDLSGLEF